MHSRKDAFYNVYDICIMNKNSWTLDLQCNAKNLLNILEIKKSFLKILKLNFQGQKLFKISEAKIISVSCEDNLLTQYNPHVNLKAIFIISIIDIL